MSEALVTMVEKVAEMVDETFSFGNDVHKLGFENDIFGVVGNNALEDDYV